MGHEIVPFPPDTQPNTDILRRLIDAKELGLFFANSLGSFSETGPILHDLATNHGLFIGTYVNGRHCTGIDWQTTRAILEKSERFKDFLQTVEKNFYISNMWLYGYSPTTKDGKKGGVFKWHRDKYYSGYFRMIVSIGSTNKVMYFRENTEEGDSRIVGIRCENNSVVVLSRTSGGVNNKTISHMVENSEHSFSFVLELTKK